MYCKVLGCRYAEYHTTSYHLCGLCKKFGHGQKECKNKKNKEELSKYYNDTLPIQIQCCIITCKNKTTHTTDTHICNYCHKFYYQSHLKNCPNNPNFDGELTNNPDYCGIDPRNNNFISKIRVGYYTSTPGGMGSTWYIRNNNRNIEYLFMHSDSWGQYGDDTSDVPILNAFIDGYELELTKNTA